MKKILLTLMTVFSIVIVNAQALLNEVYTDPGTSGGVQHSEFFELYNIAPVGTGAQNLNCYTLVTYYEEGSGQNAKKGFYILDFPNLSVEARSWFVGAAAYPFSTQNPAFQNVRPDFSWNSPAFRNHSTGGGLYKMQYNGSGYTDVLLPADSVTDFLAQGSGSSGAIYAVMLFRDGQPENFFFGGMSSGTLPSNLSSLPNLNVTMQAGCPSFSINFGTLSTLMAAEFKGNTPGSDNGYARTSDGKCGAWDKTSSSNNHTPGATNGSASGLSGSLTTAITLDCGSSTGDFYTRAAVNITGFSGSVSFLEDFPIQVTMYYDNNHNGILDAGDTPHTISGVPDVKSVNDTAVATVDTFHLKYDVIGQVPPNWDLIFAFRTKRGCFDRIVPISLVCATLPVNFTTFTAARTNSSTVKLNWETAQEDNNKGFAVQRLVNSNWQIIGFVNSKAINGNSGTPLSYEYTDFNDTRGVTQYRLMQVDIDNKAVFSVIRAVRGDAQVKGKTIVYPNPSGNGHINIVFEDKNATRDIVVTDMSGRTIKQFKAVSNNNIQIDNLNTGMYTVRIVDIETGTQEVQKFVVNKR